jgi:hypothetical protein
MIITILLLPLGHISFTSRVPRIQEGRNFLFSPLNLQGELKSMQPLQWKEHKCSGPSHSNPTKATNAMEGYERKNKGGESQRTPRSRSKEFPH